MINAIPTIYKGIRFRSRLEAKWAVMFDLLGWQWQYEPIDLNGYTPDFILNFYRPFLVEVKPAMDYKDFFGKGYIQKIEKSGWEGEAIIVGAKPFFEEKTIFDAMIPVIGLFFERWEDSFENAWEGNLFKCRHCRGYSILSQCGAWKCRKCGAHDGDAYVGGIEAGAMETMWAFASNTVQYKPSARAITN